MHSLECKPSRRLGLWLAGLVILALVVVAMSALPLLVRIALAAATLGFGVWALRRATDMPSLGIDTDGSLHAQDGTGQWLALEVLDDSFVSPALVVLRYRMETGERHALTLMPDSLPAEDWRQLRVSLRWGRRIRSDTSSPDGG
ncbi:MAG: protein YgfX [Pseudomonadota bacterium]